MLFVLAGVLVLSTLPFALLKIIRNQGTGLDFATLILNGQCLFQLCKFFFGPSSEANYYGLGTGLSLLFLVPTTCFISILWLARNLFPSQPKKG